MINWTTEDYNRYVAETDDPRLVLVLERDSSGNAPDGDAYPTACWENDGRLVGSTYDDSDVTTAYFRAVRYFGDRDMVARYLRIFHDSVVYLVASTFHRGDVVAVFDTPAWRDHCGIPATAELVREDLVLDWQAWLDGDVFGVGHAFLPDRVSHDQPFDVEELNVEMECWGFYGEDYAKDCAVEYAPTLNHPELRQPFLF